MWFKENKLRNKEKTNKYNMVFHTFTTTGCMCFLLGTLKGSVV